MKKLKLAVKLSALTLILNGVGPAVSAFADENLVEKSDNVAQEEVLQDNDNLNTDSLHIEESLDYSDETEEQLNQTEVIADSPSEEVNTNGQVFQDIQAEATVINIETIDDWMPDPIVQDIVREQLGLADVSLITKELLAANIINIAIDSSDYRGLQIQNTMGLEYAESVYVSFFLDEVVGNLLQQNPFNWSLFNSLGDKINGSVYGKLEYLFPNGINGNEISWPNFSFDPHNVYLTQNIHLNQDNYQSFFISLDDLKLSNISLDANLISYVYLANGMNYSGEMVNDGILFTLMNPEAVDYADIAGTQVLNNPNAVSYPEGPFAQLALQSSGNISGYLNAVLDFYFADIPVAGGEITVNYVDEEGNTIADPIVLSGNVGDSYVSEQKEIEGYTFKEVSGNTTGSFTAEVQTITYTYTKNQPPVAVKGADVTVVYVDEAGNVIAPPIVLSGNVGESYTSEQKNISGYTFKELKGMATGSFKETAQTVTYVYTKNVISKEVTKKEIKGTSVLPTVNNQITSKISPTVNKTIKKQLPQTGETYSSKWQWLGVVLLSSLALGTFFSKKKKTQ